MNAWYLISAPAWIIIIITAAARLADLGREHWDLAFHFRRIGLAGTGACAAIMLLTPFTDDAWGYAMPTWWNAALGWSWAIVWMTTEGLPPWWDYILGVHRKTDEWKGSGFSARMRGEARAMRDSFKPRRFKHPPMAGPKGPLP